MRYPHKPTFSLYMLALEALGLKSTVTILVEANDANDLEQALIIIRETCAGMPAPLPKLEDRKRQILVVLEFLAADLLRLSPPCYCDEGDACPAGRARKALAPLERPEPEPLVPSAMAAEVAADAERLLEGRLAGLGATPRRRYRIAGVRPGTPWAEAAAAATPGPVSVGYTVDTVDPLALRATMIDELLRTGEAATLEQAEAMATRRVEILTNTHAVYIGKDFKLPEGFGLEPGRVVVIPELAGGQAFAVRAADLPFSYLDRDPPSVDGSAWPRRLGDFANPNLGIPWPALGAVDLDPRPRPPCPTCRKPAADFGVDAWQYDGALYCSRACSGGPIDIGDD